MASVGDGSRHTSPNQSAEVQECDADADAGVDGDFVEDGRDVVELTSLQPKKPGVSHVAVEVG